MRFKRGSFLFSLLSFGAALIFYYALGRTFILTALNAIFSFAGDSSNILSEIVMLTFIPILTAFILHLQRSRSNDGYKEYVKEHHGIPYDPKCDFHEIRKDPYILGEFMLISIYFVIYIIICFFSYFRLIFFTDHSFLLALNAFWMLVYIPLFWVSNVFFYMIVHKRWMKEHEEL